MTVSMTLSWQVDWSGRNPEQVMRDIQDLVQPQEKNERCKTELLGNQDSQR